MKNFHKRLAGFSLGIVLTLGVGACLQGVQHAPIGVKAETKEVDFDANSSTKASTAVVKVGTVENKNAMKAGTGSDDGKIALTIPAKATSLSFYTAAWKGSTNVTLAITCVDTAVIISNAKASISADNGISNNSPFTLSASDDSTFKVTTELSNVTAKTTITLDASVNRFVVWNPTVELPESTDPSIKITSDADEVAKTKSGKFTYELKNIEQSAATVTWASSDTNSVTVDNEGNYNILDGGEITITATLANSEGSELATDELKLVIDYGTVTVAKLIEITKNYTATYTSKCSVTVRAYLVDLTSVYNSFVISDTKADTADGNKFNVYQIWSNHALRNIAIINGQVTFTGNPATYSSTAQLTNISYKNYTDGAIEFAKTFNSALVTACADPEANNEEAVKAQWSTLAAAFAELDEYAVAKVKAAKSTDTDENLAKFASLYDHIVTRYKLTDFVKGSTSTAGAPGLLSASNNSLTITIIVLVSVLSVSLIIGTTLIIRKRKVN